MKYLIKKFIEMITLLLFKRKWRNQNRHNRSFVERIFPIDIVKVGNYSYGVLNVYYYNEKLEGLTIGNFVSIADNVSFVLGGNHDYDVISTYPFNSLVIKNGIDAKTKGHIIVEDDVWIGQNSLILSGLKISQGAIIAAGSVVTKDVPPYAIVGGNPAHIIKYRFEPEIIEKLMTIDYSKFDDNFITENENLLHTKINKSNIDELITKIKKRRENVK